MGMARIGAGAGFEEGKTLYNGDNLFSFIFPPRHGRRKIRGLLTIQRKLMSTCNGMVFELNGARALSDFRAARVLAALQRVFPTSKRSPGRFVHFVHASRELTKAEEERLASLHLRRRRRGRPRRPGLHGGAASWHDLALGLEGHGHREELRHRRRPARRARHGLQPRPQRLPPRRRRPLRPPACFMTA